MRNLWLAIKFRDATFSEMIVFVKCIIEIKKQIAYILSSQFRSQSNEASLKYIDDR